MEQKLLFAEIANSKKPAWEFQHHNRNGAPAKKFRTFPSKEVYYKSEEWAKVRAFALHRAGNRCQRCGRSEKLEVHHLTYDNLFHERPQDLEVLCPRHHRQADREREQINCYNNARDTYFEKKYGPDFEYFDGCEDEFERWLERQPDCY